MWRQITVLLPHLQSLHLFSFSRPDIIGTHYNKLLRHHAVYMLAPERENAAGHRKPVIQGLCAGGSSHVV